MFIMNGVTITDKMNKINTENVIVKIDVINDVEPRPEFARLDKSKLVENLKTEFETRTRVPPETAND